MSKKFPPAPGDERLDESLLRDLLFQADTALYQRLNMTLLAESVFFAAFSQVWGSGGVVTHVLFCLLGLSLTLTLWEPTRLMALRTEWLASKLKRKNLTYRSYLHGLKVPRKQTANLAERVPALFVFGWFIFLVAAVLRCASPSAAIYLGGCNCS